MKRSCVLTVLTISLLFTAFCISGCSQPGETMAEGHRRHKQILSINQSQLMEDVDRVMLLHEPSKLTDKRIR